MISRVLVLLLGLTALAHSKAEASDALLKVRNDLLDNIVGNEPSIAGATAEPLQNLYDGTAFPRDEKILHCLREVKRCWEDVSSDASRRPSCIATARDCRQLVLTTSGAPLPVQIEEIPPSDITLYKTLDLCGDEFEVSKLHEAATTDADLALSLEYMKQKGVRFSSYCYLFFYSSAGSKEIAFHPIKFNPGEILGNPSPDIPSYEVTIDEVRHQVILGHYVK